MLNSKRLNVAVVAVVVFSLLAGYAYIPLARAASLQEASDLVGSSAPGVSTTHTITIVPTNDIISGAGNFIDIDFGSFIGAVVGNVICDDGNTASTTPNGVGCLVDTATIASTSVGYEISVSGVTNPTPPQGGSEYPVVISTYNSSYVEQETATMLVYIIEQVTVSATVDASLTFTVGGVAGAQDVFTGVLATDGATTATTVPFSTITSSGSTTLAQALTVSTNASDGYIVTVEQDGELTTDVGATINSFNNSPDLTGSSTPNDWVSPAGDLDDDWTYGHMGVTSNDDDLVAAGYNDYYVGTSAHYVGLNSTDPLVVMQHEGPADATTQNKGAAMVAYTIEITDLQEAGDYSASLTYICTPTY